MSGTAKTGSLPDSAPSLWEPLRVPTFRNLLAANLVSDIGAFMQSVGAAWMMVSLHGGPIFVALTQTASSLPFFLLALPAGSAGDIFDRRKLILATETWMTVVAAVIAALTIAGWMTPWLLLALTFALAAGDAFETPSWRAILPELVPRESLPSASALNGIEFNLARAIGPALAGAVIAAAGVATAFVANFASFFGVILVVAKWKRPVRKRTAPPESFKGATIAALRYVRYSPDILTVTVRTGVVMFFSSAIFALLPSLARDVESSAIGYGLLLGFFGMGAIGGALVMQSARSRWSTEAIVTGGVILLGLVTAAASGLHSLGTLGPVMFLGGGAWTLFISLISALVQNLAPDWVRARVLAVFILMYQGSFAAGSAAWGGFAERAGVRPAMLAAGIATVLTAGLALIAKLPDSNADLSPWNHWRVPVVVSGGDDVHRGPVLVTVAYTVIPERRAEFVAAMHRYQRIRRRDGAYSWGIFQDTEAEDEYLETFLVRSWAEHLRQHERMTQTDHELERLLRSYVKADPVVHHLIHADDLGGLE